MASKRAEKLEGPLDVWNFLWPYGHFWTFLLALWTFWNEPLLPQAFMFVLSSKTKAKKEAGNQTPLCWFPFAF
jgi:hypothetical protein